GLRDEVAAEWRRMLDQIEAGITPASVDLFAPYLLPNPATLADYLGDNALAVVDEPGAVALAARQLAVQADELESGFVANGELPAGLRAPIAGWATVATALAPLANLRFGGESAPTKDDAADEPRENAAGIVDPPHFLGRIVPFVDEVRDRLADGWRVVVATDQVDRLTDIFEENNIFPRRDKRRGPTRTAADPPPPGTLEIQ